MMMFSCQASHVLRKVRWMAYKSVGVRVAHVIHYIVSIEQSAVSLSVSVCVLREEVRGV